MNKTSIDRLYEIGFIPVGNWTLSNGLLNLNLNSLVERRNVLYAFVSDDTVLYVAKTNQTLRRRMIGFAGPREDQRTNDIAHNALLKLLNEGSPVDIFALADNGLHSYGGFHLDLAAGLEESVIETLRPIWNGSRSSRYFESHDEANPPDDSTVAFYEMLIDRKLDGFSLTLQPAYWKGGFFNVPTECEKLFAGDQAGIEIYCGEEKSLIHGKINRTARANQAPRIMGNVPLRSWFQQKDVKHVFQVSILGPTCIWIR